MPLEEYLKTIPAEIQKEMTVVKTKDYLYHISTDPKIKKFTPRICDRSQEGEDRSIPRICVAENIMDCMLGYIDIFSNILKTCEKEGDYLGGWKIYAFETPYMIKPSKALLPDVEKTNERWLVNHSEETASYEPIEAGILFVNNLSLIPNKGTTPKGIITFYLQCYLDSGMKLDEGFGDPDSEGFYKFDIPLDRFVIDPEETLPEVIKDRNIFNFERIDKNTFLSAKRKRTMSALASYQSTLPTFATWGQ